MGYRLKDSNITEGKIMSVLKLHAEGWKPSDICTTVELNYKSVAGLIAEPTNKAFIDDFRRGYMARVMEVPVANKRIRLDDLEYSRTRLIAILEGLLPKPASEGEDQEKEDITKTCGVIRRLVEVLERAQNEMEQRPVFLAQIVSGYNEFGRMSDEALYEKRQELLSIATRSITVNNNNSSDVIDGEISE